MANLTGVSVTQPAAGSVLSVQPDKHGFYLKPFTSGVASFVEADNYADLIVGALPFGATVDAAEIVTLSGRRIRGDRTITADNQTFRVRAFLGEEKHTRLYDRMVTRKGAPNQGEPMAFLRSFPDYIGILGVATVENMSPESDPEADAYGYDVEAAFSDFDWVNVMPVPTASAVSPTGGAAGTTVSTTGTDLNLITAAEFVTSGGVLTATVTSFLTQTSTGLSFSSPTGLTATVTYNVRLRYAEGTVAAGTFAAA
jgi:hypothetical protein